MPIDKVPIDDEWISVAASQISTHNLVGVRNRFTTVASRRSAVGCRPQGRRNSA
jgi:hypothetical protein